MRCPKCGAFMDEGRDVCFMCGTNVKNPNMSMNNGYYGQQGGGAFPGLNDYDNIYNSVKNGDKDVFDFFADHKGLVSFLSFILVLVGIFIAGLIYYKVKSKTVKLQPIIGQLYYKVDDVFQNNGDGLYSLSGDKGSSCNILVKMDSNSSDNHVDTLFDSIKVAIEPERDNKLAVVNRMQIYTTQEGTITINNNKWYYLNIFYPTAENKPATVLKYRFLTTVVNGYAYDIELRNNNSEDKCSAALDNFVRSFQFLEATAEKK